MSSQSTSWKDHINPPVFFGSAGVIIVLVIFGVAAPGMMEDVFGAVQDWIIHTFGWFYLLAVAVFLILAIIIATSSMGNIRLGPDDSKPDYGYLSWFSMLFSAGMGIGLIFYGVAEPVLHYKNPPIGDGETAQAAATAMRISFFHWGVHAWAIYAVIGMALAYFGYRYNLPLTIRSSLYPLIGDRIHGPIGHAVDIFAIFGTMFGVATSLGLGVMQVNAGLEHLFGWPSSTANQIILIAFITGIATISVVLGLDAGIKRLSVLNVALAGLLLAFVLLAGPTLTLLNLWIQNTGEYLGHFVQMTLSLNAYEDQEARGWMGGWTLFYWAWWIAWSPFVGMFIARISRGRTIREFIVGVLLVPVGVTSLWLTVFGNSAIEFDRGIAAGALTDAISFETVDTAMFELLAYLPLSEITSMIAIILVMTFFVTSSDSGSLVIDIIASGGRDDPPVWQRVFWAVSEGVVAAMLLLAGGLTGLQTGALAAALPFTFMMLVLCYGLFKGLRLEQIRQTSMDLPSTTFVKGGHVDWQSRLNTIIHHPRHESVKSFLDDVVRPALEDIAGEITSTQNLDAEVTQNNNRLTLRVHHGEEQDFVYGVEIKKYSGQNSPFADDRKGYSRAEVHLLEGGQHYDIFGYTQEQVINDALSQYERHIHFLHMVR